MFLHRYLPTYRLSQDPLELFFGTLRRRLGNNDNPNVIEIAYAVRAMLCFKLDVCGTGNCEEQESLLNKLTDTVMLEATISAEDDNDITTEADEIDIDMDVDLCTFTENIVVYIAGNVGRKLYGTIACSDCQNSLRFQDEELMRMREDYVLLLEKDGGGLFKPSEDLLILCKLIEKIIRLEQAKGVFKLNVKSIERKVIKECVNRNIFSNIHQGFYCKTFRKVSFELRNKHKFDLISSVCKQYAKLRLYYIANRSTLNLKPNTLRSKCKKIVQFSGD